MNETKTELSRTLTIIAGVAFLVMGSMAFLAKLNMVGSILLIGIGIIGIVGSLTGSFKEKSQN